MSSAFRRTRLNNGKSYAHLMNTTVTYQQKVVNPDTGRHVPQNDHQPHPSSFPVTKLPILINVARRMPRLGGGTGPGASRPNPPVTPPQRPRQRLSVSSSLPPPRSATPPVSAACFRKVEPMVGGPPAKKSGSQSPSTSLFSSPAPISSSPPPYGGTAVGNPAALVEAAAEAHRDVVDGKTNQLHGGFDRLQWLYYDEHCGVITDRFPKAAFHFLILARNTGLLSLNDLRGGNGAGGQEHDRLLEHMSFVASQLTQAIQREIPQDIFDASFSNNLLAYHTPGKNSKKKTSSSPTPVSTPSLRGGGAIGSSGAAQNNKTAGGSPENVVSTYKRPSDPLVAFCPTPQKARFRVGFHGIPSLPMLHCHVISLDLCGVSMKSRKHYNSYGSNFFLPIHKVILDMRKHQGRVRMNQKLDKIKGGEGAPPRCLWCAHIFNDMTQMKQHLCQCSESKLHETWARDFEPLMSGT